MAVLAPLSAQAQDNPADDAPKRTHRAFIQPGDPALASPDQLTPNLDVRLFAESFLVSIFEHELEEVYDSYLHPLIAKEVGRERFREQMQQFTQAVGSLDRVVVTYLREENQRYEGMDGGWADFLLVCERDPRIEARVEYRRVSSGHWKVYDYGIRSAQLDRVQRARAAAEEAARRLEEEAEESGDRAEPPAVP